MMWLEDQHLEEFDIIFADGELDGDDAEEEETP